MDKHFLKTDNGTFLLRRKSETLGNGLTYTESGNNITVTAYNGSDTDVKITEKTNDMYILARPGILPKLNITGYVYTNNNNNVIILTKYQGIDKDIDVPIIEE